MAQRPLSTGMPQAPFVDPGSGDIALVWRMFLTALWNRTGAGPGASLGDAATKAALAAETLQRQTADIALTTGLATETARAEAAESALGQDIAREAQLRSSQDLLVQYDIDQAVAAEARLREAADALLVPIAQLCALWAQCNLLFLPTTNPGHGLPWQLDGYVVLGLPPPAPAIGVEAGVDQWITEDGTGQWLWG